MRRRVGVVLQHWRRGGRRGAPAVERHTRGGGKEGDGDDGREVGWRVNSRISMINWRKCSCYCFVFLLIKCYLAQGLLTSASLALEGSVRAEGKIKICQ